MLFEEVFNNTEWHGKRDSYINDKWKNEINKWLLFIQSKNQLERYLPRLKVKRIRRGALAEISSAYIVEVKLQYPIIGWDKKTVGDKDVDFVMLDNTDEVYSEVKCPVWEGELKEEERLSGRKNQPKHVNGESRSIGPWRAIRYVLRKAYSKFLPNCKNLVILRDDLFVNILDIPECLDIALFEDSGIYDGKKGYFTSSDFENIGGILVLDCRVTNEFEYQYKFIANDTAREPFLIRLP